MACVLRRGRNRCQRLSSNLMLPNSGIFSVVAIVISALPWQSRKRNSHSAGEARPTSPRCHFDMTTGSTSHLTPMNGSPWSNPGAVMPAGAPDTSLLARSRYLTAKTGSMGTECSGLTGLCCRRGSSQGIPPEHPYPGAVFRYGDWSYGA